MKVELPTVDLSRAKNHADILMAMISWPSAMMNSLVQNQQNNMYKNAYLVLVVYSNERYV